MSVVNLFIKLLEKAPPFKKAIRYFLIFGGLLPSFAFMVTNAQAAESSEVPVLESITGGEADGRYNVGDKITISANFNRSIAPSGAASPSQMTVKLDTGPDNQKVDLVLKNTVNTIMDMGFGKPNQVNVPNVNDTTGIWSATQFSDDRILLAGSFSAYEGVTTRNLVLLDDKGKVIRTFGGSGSASIPNSPSFSDEVFQVLITSENKILVYGRFLNYNGNARYDYIVQFNEDFTIDAEFMGNLTKSGSVNTFTGTPYPASGNRYYYTPNSIVIEHNKKIYLVGGFTAVGGVSNQGVASLNLDGTNNAAFKSPITYNTRVSSIRLDNNDTPADLTDDTFFVTGQNIRTGADGNSQKPVWKLNQNGSVDTSFIASVNGQVNDIQILAKDKQNGVVVTGVNIGGADELVALNEDGSKKSTSEWALQGLRAGYAAEAFEIIEDKLFIGAHNGWSAYGNNALIVINMEDGTLNDTFMDIIGRNAIFYNGAGRDVHGLFKMNDGSLLIMGNFEGYNGSVNDERAIVKFKFNRLSGTYTVREEDKDLTGLMLVDSIVDYKVDSVFGGFPSTTTPDVKTLPKGSLEANSHYSLNRLPADPVQSTLEVDKATTPTSNTIVATVTAVAEDGTVVGKNGDTVSFAIDNDLVSMTKVVDHKDGTYSVTLSTTEVVNTTTKITAVLNDNPVQNGTDKPAEVEVTFLDVTPPTVTMTADKDSLSIGKTATLTIEMSEDTTNFEKEDITVAGGTITAFSGSGKNYQATFSPGLGLEQVTTATIKLDVFTDAAGNGNENTQVVSFDTDTKSPIVAEMKFDRTLVNVNQTATLSIKLSEVVTNFGLEDFIVTNGSLSGFTGSGTDYSVTFKPEANIVDKAVISVMPIGAFFDESGNSNVIGKSATINIDSVAPTATITTNKPTLGGGESAVLTITLSEAATDFIFSDLSVEGGTLSNFTGSDKTYNVTFTPTDGSDAAGKVTIAAGSFTDAAGNRNTEEASINLMIDTVAPSAVLTSDKSAVKKGETAKITITLSEASTNLVQSDLTVLGGELTNFSGLGTSYVVTFVPTADSTVDGVVTLLKGAFTDSEGNANTEATSVTVKVDTAAPTMLITSNKPLIASGDTATITFTLSEVSTNFTASDITVVGGTLGELAGSGIVYNAIFTPTENSDSASTISVTASSFSDAAGNLNEKASSVTVNVDTIAPTIQITANKTALMMGESATLTFTLSENSTNLLIDDFSVVGGTLSGFTGSGKIYSATFTPTAGSNVSAEISIAAGRFTDAVGNSNTLGASIVIAVDTVAPTATLNTDKTEVKKDESAIITITLSEPSTDLELADFTAIGGTLSQFAGSGENYSVTFTPSNNSTANGVINLTVGTFSDVAGNKNTVAASTTIKVDSVVPTITASSSKSLLASGESATIVFALSEISTTFTASDITATGGTLSAFNGTGTSYSAVFTPSENSSTDGVINVASGVFTDEAGNKNETGTSVTINIDTIAPVATITTDKRELSAEDVATLTITLSEESVDFDLNDLVVTNGALSEFTGNGKVYNVVFTPELGSATSGSVTIAANKFSDAVGNKNKEEATINFVIDTVLPTVTLTSNKQILGHNEVALITITLDEVSTNFTVEDITYSDGVLSNFSGSGKNYTVNFTANDNLHKDVDIIVEEGVFTDKAGNKNVAGSVTLTINTAKPSSPKFVKQMSNKAKPVVKGTAEANNTVFVTMDGFTFETITPATGTADGTHVEWVLDTATAKKVSNGTFSGLEDGSHDVSVSSMDAYGNSSDTFTVAGGLYVDTHRPNPPMIQPYSIESIILSGTAEPHTVINVKTSNQDQICTDQPVDKYGFWSCLPELALVNGTYITAVATDAVLNESLSSGVIVKNRINRDFTAVNVFPTDGHMFSGMGEYSAKVTVTNISNETVCTTYVNPLGLWQCEAKAMPEFGGSLIKVSQLYKDSTTSVTTSVIDSTTEVAPPKMTSSSGSLFEGTSMYRDGTVNIVARIDGQICQASVVANTGIAHEYSCINGSNISATALEGQLVYSYISRNNGVFVSGLSAPVLIGAMTKDSDLDGRTDLEEWNCNGNSAPCIDSDGDGIPNYLDVDDDGDGILSKLEEGSNYLNLDSDGDGISDEMEGATYYPELNGIDVNNNGIDDAIDAAIMEGNDLDDNGIDDRFQPIDTDNDGVPDYADVDSDGDTIPDIIEGTIDSDSDTIANYLDIDSDNDGIPDSIEAGNDPYEGNIISTTKVLVNPKNSDKDSLPDYIDLDSDNDGIYDIVEAGGNDEDGNALLDPKAPLLTNVIDTDGDGIPDYMDVDSTNDGTFDLVNSGKKLYVNSVYIDNDFDGMVDNITDKDKDGIADIIDGALNIFGSLPSPNDDFDGDGIPNQDDLDSDNDGIPDSVEGNQDTDGDGLADAYDLDSDNDGIPDIQELFSELDLDKLGHINRFMDENKDGADDRINLNMTRNELDFDQDGLIDSQDIDSDNDGIFDLYEAVGLDAVELLTRLDANFDGTLDVFKDSDGDGISNAIDDLHGLGVTASNSFMSSLALSDTDNDGMRDFQDTDSDNDGYSDQDEFIGNEIIGNMKPYTVTVGKTAAGGSIGIIGMLLMLCIGWVRTLRVNVTWSVFASLLLLSTSTTAVESETVVESSATKSESSLIFPKKSVCGYTDEDGVFKGCWYGNLGLGISRLAVEDTESQGWSGDGTTYDPGVSVALGYQLTERIFTELSYHYLGKAKLKNENTVSPEFSGSEYLSYHVPSFSVGGYIFPQSPEQNFNMYARIGVSSMRNVESDDRIIFETENDIQLNLGAGIEYRPYRSPWFGRLDFVSFDQDAKTLNLVLGRYLGGAYQPKVVAPAPVVVEPISAPVPQVIVEKITSSSILGFFETDSSNLGVNGKQALRNLTKSMYMSKEYKVIVSGHTDSVGSDDYNIRLGERRAKSVEDFLVNEMNLDANAIQTISYGKSNPIATNATQEGRAKNRRVDIEVQYIQ